MKGGAYTLVLGALLAVGSIGRTWAQASPVFDHMVVFGDSLSDVGNAGRFSNGPVWVEQLAALLRLELTAGYAGGSNFAVGGALLNPDSGPHNLREQADLFLSRAPPHGRTLHVIWAGGNDLLAAVGSSDAMRVLDAAAASLESIVGKLVARGATDFLAPNLPDIGMTPALRSAGPAAVAEGRHPTDTFNAATDRAVSNGVDGSAVRLLRLDVRGRSMRVRDDPASFDLSDVTTPCGGISSCDGYLFWDDVHPTTQAHRRLAEAAFRSLTSTAD